MGTNMKVTELDRYLFGQGTHYEIYKLFGAHPGTQRKKEGVFLLYGRQGQRVCLL